MTTPEQLAANIEATTHGRTEWRVQHPVEKSFCMSFGSDSINPERECREWLADHLRRHPDSQFAGYEVAKVHFFTMAEQRALDAAAMLRTMSAQVEQLKLAEVGAAQAFGDVVQDKRDLEKEVKRLQSLLDGAYASIRKRAQASGA
jgi:hypothetical protein